MLRWYSCKEVKKMDIKSKLKEVNVTLSDFANKLEVSRPTLNNYITLYEKGEELPNEKYQLIFEELFEDDVNTKEEFEATLDRYNKLLTRDKLLGTIQFDTKTTDLMTSIIERMKEDLQNNDYDDSIYVFINNMIGSYRDDPSFSTIANFALYLNNIKDLEEIKNEDKPFISNFYKLLELQKEDKLMIDQEYYNKFINEVKELETSINNEQQKKAEEIYENTIKERINKEIQEQLKLGLDIKEINIDKIMNKIGLSSLNNKEESK